MLRTLLAEIKEYKAPSLLTPLCMVGEVVCEMLTPLLMGQIVDRGINGGDMGFVVRTGLLMLVVAVIGFCFGVLGGFTAAKAAAGFAKNLRKAMFHKIQTFSFANIDQFSSASLVTRMTTDVTNIQNSFMMILRMAIRAPMSMLIAVVMSFLINARLASIYLVAVTALAVVLLLVMRTATTYFRQVFEKYDELNESVRENVSAIRVVKAYVREDHEITKFQKAAANIYLMFVKAEKIITGVAPLMMGTVYACILLISWFGARFIISSTLTTGELMSLLTYCTAILMNLMFLAVIFVMLTMSQASAKRIVEVIDTTSSLTNPEDPVYEVKDGSIRFDMVDFSYHPESPEAVLKDIVLEIRSGEMIGILGGTGSAKSSLVALISRLYDVTGGAVYVGGRDVRDYDLDTLRQQVAVVLQNNVLFSGTILDNLRWGDPDATEEECREACRMACADEFIAQMPDGYQTVISQGGTNVSGGQKQRLCIARALLRKPKILILDDSTSAVDTATDAKIRTALQTELPDVTKLIIAQRINSVKDCDRILVMDDGRISGFGTHDELLANNTIYQEVFESQIGQNDGADFDGIDGAHKHRETYA